MSGSVPEIALRATTGEESTRGSRSDHHAVCSTMTLRLSWAKRSGASDWALVTHRTTAAAEPVVSY